jgi:transcriptional regulator with XRE-family HTH domain
MERVRDPQPQARDDDDTEWRRWMQALGQRLRQMRELAQLSQEELARLAGVSQGAVSRLETARGMATPMVVVMKISLAVAHRLRMLATAAHGDHPELRQAIEAEDVLLSPLANAGEHPLRIPGEAGLEEVVRMYRDLGPRQRVPLIAVLRAVSSVLKVIVVAPLATLVA